MRLELTKRWVEHKSFTQDLELYDGLRIEYYGNGSEDGGTIVEKQPGVFYIEWDEDVSDTPIDGSEKSNLILKECGYE